MEFKKGPEFVRAEQLLPMAWYEDYVFIVAAGAVAGVGSGLGVKINHEFSASLTFPLIAAGLYIAGRLLDMHSTLKGLELFEIAELAGVEHTLREINPFFEDRPPSSTFLQWQNVIKDYAVAGLTVLFPPIGFAAALSSALIALNNYRKVERLTLAINLKTSRGLY